ncbi:MAG TPA: hypothetical protein VFD43_12670 [Planctomycetota bacterium]|nr:hypothetical protein [Planctomycetota bacterium]
MIATRLALALALALGACANPSYGEARADLPAIPPDRGRIVFLGDNLGRYGPLEGGDYEPVIAVDGWPLDVGHGLGVCFAVDAPAGMRTISVDGAEHLEILVESRKTRYIEMQVYPEENRGFSLKRFIYRMRLLNRPESQAEGRLDQLEFLGIAE